MKHVIDYQGQAVEIHTSASGSVFWCSHWHIIDAMVAAGLLIRRMVPNCWCHCDYFIKGEVQS